MLRMQYRTLQQCRIRHFLHANRLARFVAGIAIGLVEAGGCGTSQIDLPLRAFHLDVCKAGPFRWGCSILTPS
jgi:hypothetical protein